ncbi:MAG: hypothetical protein ABR527_07730 [Gemmatimonadota bacterium]
MKSFRVLFGGVAFALLASCGGGGGSPTEPLLSVSGLWIVTSQLLQNTCGIQIPNTTVTNVTITQSGVQLTAQGGDITYSGTIDTRTGNFTISASTSSGGISAVEIISGRFSSNTRFSSESQATFTDGVDSCVIRSSDDGRRQ